MTTHADTYVTPMSALGHKWTFRNARMMSALPPKAESGDERVSAKGHKRTLRFVTREPYLLVFNRRWSADRCPTKRGTMLKSIPWDVWVAAAMAAAIAFTAFFHLGLAIFVIIYLGLCAYVLSRHLEVGATKVDSCTQKVAACPLRPPIDRPLTTHSVAADVLHRLSLAKRLRPHLYPPWSAMPS